MKTCADPPHHTLTSSGITHHNEHPSIRLALKVHTKSYHDRMEATLAYLLHPLTIAEYRTVLTRFYGLYAPLEDALTAVLTAASAPLDFSQRRKTPLLERDLYTIGVTATDVLTLPRCPFIPSLPDLAHALGCLYVLEGATLGGQIISRRIYEQFGFTREYGCAFFHSYGEHVGPMWQVFCTVLTDTLTTPLQQEAAITTACATFATFERWVIAEQNK